MGGGADGATEMCVGVACVCLSACVCVCLCVCVCVCVLYGVGGVRLLVGAFSFLFAS